MNKTQMNLQDNFLNQVRKDSVPVTIYLVSGVQLKGHVRGFDSFTVVLESPGKPSQLVYKHAMASVVPARPISTAPPRDDRDRDREREERPRGPEPERAPEVEAEPAAAPEVEAVAEPEAEPAAEPEPEPEPEPELQPQAEE